MGDVECPYCGEEVEICHDDGYGYDEEKVHEQNCYHCGQNFAYETSISFRYEAKQADCLNGAPHDMEPVIHVPRCWPNWRRCTACGYEERGEFKDDWHEELSGC